ncbi:MAG: response regulator [Candidatus Paceibacterota bacterium]
MIVEDDKVLSFLLSKMVEKLGHQISDVITKGSEAITQIQALKPDLILMDIMLEDNIDGIEVMAHLRGKSIHTPVIYITGNSDQGNIQRAKKTNYLDYLIKPVSYEELKKRIIEIH